jgi:hypothetical protein
LELQAWRLRVTKRLILELGKGGQGELSLLSIHSDLSAGLNPWFFLQGIVAGPCIHKDFSSLGWLGVNLTLCSLLSPKLTA